MPQVPDEESGAAWNIATAEEHKHVILEALKDKCPPSKDQSSEYMRSATYTPHPREDRPDWRLYGASICIAYGYFSASIVVAVVPAWPCSHVHFEVSRITLNLVQPATLGRFDDDAIDGAPGTEQLCHGASDAHAKATTDFAPGQPLLELIKSHGRL